MPDRDLPSGDTIAAVSTPLGEGGIGVVRISGSDALSVVARAFRSSVPVVRIPSRQSTLGHVVDPVDGETIDQALLTLYRAPRSYTGEDVAEISGHGGIVVVRRVLEACLRSGARLARPGEFTERAFLNGRIDLARAEAVADTIRAKSAASLRIAVNQLEGRLSERLHDLRTRLLDLMSLIEASIDFPDDVDEPDRGEVREAIDSARSEIDRLLSTAEAGRVYREGIAAAIAGKPNVGKSSLMNALLRDSRAIVTDVPGTTRDLLEETLMLGGIPLRLLDMAGLRPTEDAVERIGVERAREALADADLALLVLDRSRPLEEEDRIAWEAASGKRRLLIVNKIDLPPAWDDPTMFLTTIGGAAEPVERCEVSLRTGEGVDRLEEAITKVVLGGGIEPARIFVSSVRHQAALEAASAALGEANRTVEIGYPLDLVAGDLRAAADQVAGVTGENVAEEVIDEIFRRFCVGK